MVLDMKYVISGDWMEIWVDGKCVGAFSKHVFPEMMVKMCKALKK